MGDASVNESGYECEVAFSFLADDAPLAVQLSDLLSDRYTTFVYPRCQEAIVGTDGQETFARIFGKSARCVVVLFRNGWGATEWTRVEQTAIQNRALGQGWDFLLLVKLDARAETPRWLHKSYIWHDFEHYGVNGAVGAISALIQRQGFFTRMSGGIWRPAGCCAIASLAMACGRRPASVACGL